MRQSLVALCALSLIACIPMDPAGPDEFQPHASGYNLTLPIALAVPPATIPEDLPGAIKRLQLEVQYKAFKSSIESLGGKVDATAAQRVALVVDQGCAAGEVGDVDASAPRTIRVCADTYTDYAKLDWNIRHQLGHVLGAKHLSCSPDAVMSTYFECFRGTIVQYTARDKNAICASTICN